MINMILTIGMILYTINSQPCSVEEQSPNNPPNAGCEVGFFDLSTNPSSNCICCVPNIDDNPADECINSPNKTVSGVVECSENFDCCSCDIITCNNCVDIKCNGDSSCIGVNPFIISGSNSGTSIICDGDLSCFRAGFTGTNIKLISCGGDNSCEQTTFNDISCINSGCEINIGGDGILRNNTNIFANITNVASLSCGGDESCPNSLFDLRCINTGCPLLLVGDAAAQGTIMLVDQATLVECAGEESCSHTIFSLNCVNNGCPILCSGSCPFSDFNIINSNGVTCNGVIELADGGSFIGTCELTVFILDNNVGGDISCEGVQACKNAVFIAPNDNRITNIGAVFCSGKESCFNTIITVECEDQNGCELSCIGNNACAAPLLSQNSTKNVIDISNVISVGCDGGITTEPVCGNRQFILQPLTTDFGIGCSGSCVNSTFDVTTDLTNIKSIECSSTSGCDNTIFNIEGSNTNGLTIDEVKCSASTACINSNFNIVNVGDITLSKFECGDLNSCETISMDINLASMTGTLTTDIVCGGQSSCLNAVITVKRIGIVLSETDVKALNIKIQCGGAGSCNGATVNGVPFTDSDFN